LKLDRDKLIRAREMLGYAIETVAEEAGISKNSVLRAEHEEDIRPVTARKSNRRCLNSRTSGASQNPYPPSCAGNTRGCVEPNWTACTNT
jgi:hypothetical protein